MRTAAGVSFLCLALAGCVGTDVLRHDGVTTSAGDAVAANSVMQMADPWPRGVENTRLRTPAVRPGAESAGETAQ